MISLSYFIMNTLSSMIPISFYNVNVKKDSKEIAFIRFPILLSMSLMNAELYNIARVKYYAEISKNPPD